MLCTALHVVDGRCVFCVVGRRLLGLLGGVLFWWGEDVRTRVPHTVGACWLDRRIPEPEAGQGRAGQGRGQVLYMKGMVWACGQALCF